MISIDLTFRIKVSKKIEPAVHPRIKYNKSITLMQALQLTLNYSNTKQYFRKSVHKSIFKY